MSVLGSAGGCPVVGLVFKSQGMKVAVVKEGDYCMYLGMTPLTSPEPSEKSGAIVLLTARNR